MGGWSPEREVSLATGASCVQACKAAGYKVTAVDVGRDIADVLTRLKPDVALNVLHGTFGEDGGMQAILEELSIPYTHSGVHASALAMDKAKSRDAFIAAGIPVAAGKVVSRFEAIMSPVFEPPFVIKPLASGSSVGVYIVREGEESPREIGAADWKHGDNVLVEKYIPGRELTCAVLGDRALGVIEVVPDEDFYDYKAKYSPGGSKHILPAPVDAAVYKRVQDVALQAHQALGCRGVSRADFRYDDKTGELVCLEVNTQPGMTGTSPVPHTTEHAGLSFPQLVACMINAAPLNR